MKIKDLNLVKLYESNVVTSVYNKDLKIDFTTVNNHVEKLTNSNFNFNWEITQQINLLGKYPIQPNKIGIFQNFYQNMYLQMGNSYYYDNSKTLQFGLMLRWGKKDEYGSIDELKLGWFTYDLNKKSWKIE